jgi:hypothetical protein
VSEQEFRTELHYRMSLSVAKAMRREGLISDAELLKIDAFLLEKYQPLLGTLLAGKPSGRV